jgi:hypothetical protein
VCAFYGEIASLQVQLSCSLCGALIANSNAQNRIKFAHPPTHATSTRTTERETILITNEISIKSQSRPTHQQ